MKLNRTQRGIVWAGLACLCLLVLYPPDYYGRHFLFEPRLHAGAGIDWFQFLLPMGFVVLAMVTAVFLTSDRHKE